MSLIYISSPFERSECISLFLGIRNSHRLFPVKLLFIAMKISLSIRHFIILHIIHFACFIEVAITVDLLDIDVGDNANEVPRRDKGLLPPMYITVWFH